MLIEFGLFKYIHLIVFFFPVITEIKKVIITTTEINNLLYKIFNEYLCMSFCGIIYLIIILFTKTSKEKENQTYNNKIKIQLDNLKNENDNQKINIFQKIELENLKKLRIEKRNKFFFTLLITVLQIGGMLIRNIFSSKVNQYLLKNISFLSLSIFLIIFSIIFLGFSLYRHQYFSLGIIFVCLMIFIIESIIYKDISFIEFLYGFLYFSLYEVFFCSADVLGKKYLNTYTDSIYLYLFKIGINGFIPLLLYDIIAYFCELDDPYQGIIKTIIFKLSILETFINFISALVFDVGLWLTIFYFSPCHIIIPIILLDFFKIIHELIKNEKNELTYEIGEIISFFILYPFLIIGLLVFNEIIILNFCTLNYNTKLYISKRERIESNLNIDDSYESSLYNEDYI